MAAAMAACGLAQAQTVPTIDCVTNASIFNTAYDITTGGTVPVTSPATPDAHWEASPDGVNWSPALVSGRLAGVWAISPFGNADWISTAFNPPNGAPIYYRYLFNIAPVVPLGSFAIQFDFYVDDALSNVRVNGNIALDYGIPGAGGYTPGAQTHMVITSGQWQAGLNEIVLQTYNFATPSGLMAQTTVESTCPSITKTAVPDPTAGPLTAGRVVTYTVTANNSSLVDASGSVVDDPLPAGIASGTWTCSNGGSAAVCPNASGTLPISETIGVFPPDSLLVYTITAVLADDALPATITNTAQLIPPIGELCTDGTDPPCLASVTHGLVGLTVGKIVALPASAAALDLTGDAFDFTVTCTQAAGALMTPIDVTVNLNTPTTGNTLVYGVPPGGTCSIAEIAPLPAVPNYSWDAVPPSATVAIGAANNRVDITNTLTRDASAIDLSKLVVGGPAAGVTGTFTFDADCGVDGSFTGTIDLANANAGTGTIPNVPAGATCTVTEGALPAAPANYAWGALPPPVTLTTTSSGPNPAAFTNTLTRQSASLALTKTVSGGPAAGVTATFTFDVDCGADGTFSGSVPLVGANSGSGSIASLPAGATCTVTEAALPAAPANYAWGALPAAVTLTLTPAGPNGADFINTLTRQSSAIALAKTVTGGPAGGITATFAFSADCGADGIFAGTVALTNAAAGAGSIANVPAGAACTVSENALPPAPLNYTWGALPPAVTLTTTAAGPNTAAFTNSLTRPANAIALSKTITGGPAGGISATFSFNANCGTDGTFTGSVPVTNASAGTGAIANVPVGATCTVSEGTLPAAPANYGWGAVPPPVTLTTTSAGPNAAAFTNTLTRASSIALTKTVVGGPPGGVSATFSFGADCAADGTFTGAVALGNATSGTGTIANVPAGAVCIVSENALPPAPANYAWGALPPAVSLTTTAAGPNAAAFTNTLSLVDVAVTLTKTISGGPAGGISGSFVFTIDCGAGGLFTQTVALANANSGSIGLSILPPGASCTFSEAATLPAAPVGFQWGTLPPAQVHTIAGGLAVSFTNPLVGDGGGVVPQSVPATRAELLALLAVLLAGFGAMAQRRRSMRNR